MRVIGIHYWDTRHKLRPYWEQNARIVKQSYDAVMKNLPTGWVVDHHIFIDWQADIPLVDRLAHEMGEVHHHSPKRIHHFFNTIHESAFAQLDFSSYDLIFQMSQDRLIVNYKPTNLLVLMYQMMSGEHPHLAHQRHPPYDYVSHTIPAKPAWVRWNHNAGGEIGLCRVSCVPDILTSVRQHDRAAEVWLGWPKYMGIPCLYMKVNPWIYWGDYEIVDLTPTRADYLLSLAEDHGRYLHVMQIVEPQWCASLHPLWKEIA